MGARFEWRGLALAVGCGAIGIGAAVSLVPRRMPTSKTAATSAPPTTARGYYEAGLRAQREGHYHDAREGYLHALSLDPSFADARYQLVLLTHEAGADEEARHNLNALIAIAPDDARIPALRSLLAGGRGR